MVILGIIGRTSSGLLSNVACLAEDRLPLARVLQTISSCPCPSDQSPPLTDWKLNRMTQVTSIEQACELLKQAVDQQQNVTNFPQALSVIKYLEQAPVTKEKLEQTGLARLVNEVRRANTAQNADFGRGCRALIKAWRVLVGTDHDRSGTPGSNGTRTPNTPAVRSSAPVTPRLQVLRSGTTTPSPRLQATTNGVSTGHNYAPSTSPQVVPATASQSTSSAAAPLRLKIKLGDSSKSPSIVREWSPAQGAAGVRVNGVVASASTPDLNGTGTPSTPSHSRKRVHSPPSYDLAAFENKSRPSKLKTTAELVAEMNADYPDHNEKAKRVAAVAVVQSVAKDKKAVSPPGPVPLEPVVGETHTEMDWYSRVGPSLSELETLVHQPGHSSAQSTLLDGTVQAPLRRVLLTAGTASERQVLCLPFAHLGTPSFLTYDLPEPTRFLSEHNWRYRWRAPDAEQQLQLLRR